MISSQILQSTIDEFKEITNADIRVLDAAGTEVATTLERAYVQPSTLQQFVSSDDITRKIEDALYGKVYDERELEYLLVCENAAAGTDVYLKLLTAQLEALLTAYREHYDRDSFMKNLLLDNLLQVDIYNRSRKLGIKGDETRIAILAVYQGSALGMLEAIRTTQGLGAEDYVTEVDADNVVIVKSVPDEAALEGVDAFARKVASRLEAEGLTGVHVAYGTAVTDIREVSRSYKEAKMALEVGRIFSGSKKVVSYTELGIGRLIYQLPIPLCKMFIKEIFNARHPDSFDEETIQTIEKFFENNLNVSETSRQLFIHRNTLVYRLDKLQKTTGLDLRVFEDAITFKIAMMVVKYMNYMEKTER